MSRFFPLTLLLLISPTLLAQESPAKPETPTVQQPETASTDTSIPEPERHAVELLRREAARYLNQAKCGATQRFLIATTFLPVVDARTIYWDKATRRAISPDQYVALSEAEKAVFESRTLDDKFFYYTRYCKPMAYARPVELLCNHSDNKDNPFARKRVFDFGYGTIGHLRLLASLGADVHGVEIDPLLKALYSQHEDTGVVEAAPVAQDTVEGRLTLHEGQWPANKDLAAAVGDGFDFFISKNTLKRGYIHPEQEVDPKLLVNLGVDDDTFVTNLARILKPGGLALIYNLSPAQKPDQYLPWADGRCPFPREMLESQGFEVLAFDQDDTEAARVMGRAFEWDQGASPMDLEKDLFGTYTLLRKR